MPYQTERIPLHVPAGNREASVLKDARLVNCWVEKDSAGRIWVQKRPAIVRVAQPTGVAAEGRGIYGWDTGVFGVFDGHFYGNLTSLAPINLGAVASAGYYHFVETLGATHKLFFHNGSNAYVYPLGGSLTAVSDVDFPLVITPSILAAGAAYLDGGVYVARVNGATIFGSDPNDPLSWAADNFLVAQIEPDDAVFIAKHLVYIIVGKRWTTEVFHDAGNATGSPLAPDQGLKMNFGCAYRETVQDVGGDLIWVATTREGSVSVILLSNLRAQVVSTPAIERLLEGFENITATSWSGKVGGHRLYGITLPNFTLVYDITMGLWYEWTDVNGDAFPIVSSTFDSFYQRILLQNVSDGDLYSFEMGVYVDDDGAFPVDIYTPNWDGNTRTRKQMNRLELVGDQEIDDACYIAVSDDDYQTWSDFRMVDRSLERQVLFNCGTFRRRAFHIHHLSNKAFRVQALEASVALGSL